MLSSVCIDVDLYIYTYICIHVCINKDSCVSTYTCIYTIYVCVRICLHIHAQSVVRKWCRGRCSRGIFPQQIFQTVLLNGFEVSAAFLVVSRLLGHHQVSELCSLVQWGGPWNHSEHLRGLWEPFCMFKGSHLGPTFYAKEHLVTTLNALSAVGAFVIAKSGAGSHFERIWRFILCGKWKLKAHEVLARGTHSDFHMCKCEELWT